MAWIIPKTNWVSTDYFTLSDYERIRTNVYHLHFCAEKVAGKTVTLPHTLDAKNKHSYLFASDMNHITENITYINSLYAKETIGSFRTYEAVGKAMTASELNQIERAILKIHNKYKTVINETWGELADTKWSEAAVVTWDELAHCFIEGVG